MGSCNSTWPILPSSKTIGSPTTSAPNTAEYHSTASVPLLTVRYGTAPGTGTADDIVTSRLVVATSGARSGRGGGCNIAHLLEVSRKLGKSDRAATDSHVRSYPVDVIRHAPSGHRM